MKKYIYLAIALVMGVFASCTDKDDIEIHISHDINFTVHTKKMYETFNLSNRIQNEFLRDKTYAIGVESYIYDETGALVASNSSTEFAYNDQNFSLKLNEGKYTIICIETLADPDDNNKPAYWNYEGIDNLQTFKIVPRYYDVSYWCAVVGIHSSEIVVSKDETFSIEPKAIGSMMHLKYYYWESSKYINVGFGTYTRLKEYKLTPGLDRDSRYVYENIETGIFSLKASLTPEEAKTTGNLLYFIDNEISWVFCFQKEEGTNWPYYSENQGINKLEDGKEYFGGFAYNGSTQLPSSYLGDYNGFNIWRQTLSKPQESNLTFKNPSIQWGASVSTVKSYMSGYNLVEDIKQCEDGTYGMVFGGKNDEELYKYFFMTNSNILLESDVYFDASKYNLNYLNNYIASSNYSLVTEAEGMSLYASSDYKTLALVGSAEGYSVIAYIDYEYFAGLSQSQQKRMISDCAKRISSASNVKTEKSCSLRMLPSTKSIPGFKY